MQIVMNPVEEEAVEKYAVKNNMTFDEAFKKIIDAMTKGLIEMIMEDEERIENEEMVG